MLLIILMPKVVIIPDFCQVLLIILMPKVVIIPDFCQDAFDYYHAKG